MAFIRQYQSTVLLPARRVSDRTKDSKDLTTPTRRLRSRRAGRSPTHFAPPPSQTSHDRGLHGHRNSPSSVHSSKLRPPGTGARPPPPDGHDEEEPTPEDSGKGDPQGRVSARGVFKPPCLETPWGTTSTETSRGDDDTWTETNDQCADGSLVGSHVPGTVGP